MDVTDKLIYRDLALGKDYWIEDHILDNPVEVAQRCISKSTWILGSPWRPEPWPGMRAPDALTPAELERVEACLHERLHVQVGRRQPDEHDDSQLGHNHIQIVGGDEGVARPHVDSARMCDYAGVLYLHPYPPTPHAGTSFYRFKGENDHLGGNVCPPQYESLSQVPGMSGEMDPTMFQEILEVPYVFNRLLLYKADIIHSATAYFGWSRELASKRMAVVFFWKVGSSEEGR